MAKSKKNVSELKSKEISDFYNNSNIKKTYSTDYDKIVKRLRDVAKNNLKTISTFDKARLVEFLKNISNNEKEFKRTIMVFILSKSDI